MTLLMTLMMLSDSERSGGFAVAAVAEAERSGGFAVAAVAAVVDVASDADDFADDFADALGFIYFWRSLEGWFDLFVRLDFLIAPAVETETMGTWRDACVELEICLVGLSVHWRFPQHRLGMT